jgi:hypothetical protein
VQVATKFGIVRDATGVRLDADPSRVRGYCEASLQRLGTDYIDLYYLHRVDPSVPIEETIEAMAQLVKAGLVRHLGMSECGPSELERAAVVHPITALQFEWSLWWREPESDVIPTARRLGIGLVPYSPLGRGFLTGAGVPETFNQSDIRHGDSRFTGSARQRNLEILGAFGRLATELGRTPAPARPELAASAGRGRGSHTGNPPGGSSCGERPRHGNSSLTVGPRKNRADRWTCGMVRRPKVLCGHYAAKQPPLIAFAASPPKSRRSVS